MAESSDGQRGWRWWTGRWWVAGPLMFLFLAGMRRLTIRDESLLEAVITAAVYTVVLTGIVFWRRRKDARASGTHPDRVPGLDRRIRKEDVPEDPEERRAMAILVRRRDEQLRATGRWPLVTLVVVCFVLLAGLFLALGLVVPAIVTVAVCALIFPVGLWNRRRLFARFARLTRQLETGTAASAGAAVSAGTRADARTDPGDRA